MVERPDNVVELDAYRPHICLKVRDGSAHVVSCAQIEAFVRGDLDVFDLQSIKVSSPSAQTGEPSKDWRLVIRRIVDEWYQRLIHG